MELVEEHFDLLNKYLSSTTTTEHVKSNKPGNTQCSYTDSGDPTEDITDDITQDNYVEKLCQSPFFHYFETTYRYVKIEVTMLHVQLQIIITDLILQRSWKIS